MESSTKLALAARSRRDQAGHMISRTRVALGAFALAVLGACSPRSSSFEGPTGRLIAEAASAHRVPADLMAAIAHVEGGLALPPLREAHDDDAVPVAGVLELRHGRFDSLARGAALTGLSQQDLVRDLARGTDAGARVLAELGAVRGASSGDLAAWASAVEELSGHRTERDRIAYRARVFSLLRTGGTLPVRGGEVITLSPHDEIPIELCIAPPALATQGTPEFAGAIWFETPQSGKWMAGRDGNPVTMIAIHDTEGGWEASVATLQNDPGKSVHYIIDADGSRVGQFISEADTGWHVGNGYYNRRMVGIEHVGYVAEQYETALYETSAALVRDIAARHGLGPNGDGSKLDRSVLVGHQEVPDGGQIAESSPPCADSPGTCVQSPDYGGANNHRDPGVHWNWCQYTEIIGNGAHCKCNDAYTHFNCTYDKSERIKCNDGENVLIDHCANQSCIVKPIGEDDICGEEATSSSSSSSGGTGGQGGAPSQGAGGDGGTGGDGGKGSGGGLNQSSGCAVSIASERGLAPSAALLALGALAVRRRRRTT
ncbi:N-acetylmuramoyl-L-alanine amidase [Minicystis rosea]|nr:N-acetylmuramoyl-L-alanine amidase [Minicystis rosea]